MVPNTETEAVKILMVPGQRFTCTACGKCCSRPWDIEVRPEKAQQIRESELFQEKVKEGYTPLTLVEGEIQLGRRKDGSCVFLEEDLLCSYHGRYGERAKPVPCQTFPFQYTETPDGVWVALHFSCPAVLSGYGEACESYQESLADFYTECKPLPGQAAYDGRVKLTERASVDWNQYKMLEQKLYFSLNTDYPTPVLVNAACTLLNYDGELTPEDVNSINFNQPSPILGEVLNLMDLFTQQTLSFMEHGRDPEKRREFFEKLTEGEEPYSDRFQVKLKNITGNESPNLINSSVMQRYCTNQLLGKRLLIGPTMTTRLLMLATSTGIVEYLVELMDSRVEHQHFSFDNLEEAFTAVEADVMSHSADLVEGFLEFERAALKMHEAMV